MVDKFKMKPLTCGVPRSATSNYITSPSILLNSARTPGPNSTPFDADNDWSWKDRYLIGTGMGSSVIYLDGSNTPYLLNVVANKDGLFANDERIRVVVTLVREYGVLGAYVPNHNIKLLDETYDFGEGADASMYRTLPQTVGVEQSPDGSKVLLNVEGDFRPASYGFDLKDDARTLAGILSVDISGSVAVDGSGLSASLSAYKTRDECSPSVDAGVIIESSVWHHWEETTEYVYNGFTSSGVDVGTVNMTKQSAAVIVPGYGVDDFGSLKQGNDVTRYTQNLILRAYFDSDGQIHHLGVNLSKDVQDGRNETSLYSSPDVYYESYSFRSGNLRKISLPGATYSYPHWEQGLVVDSTNTYRMSPTVNGVETDTKEYVYYSDVNTQSWQTNSEVMSYAFTWVDWVDPFIPNADPYWNEKAVLTVISESDTWWQRIMVGSVRGVDYDSVTTENYTDTDWGELVNPLSETVLTDRGFADMEAKITGNRWVSLENVRTGVRTAAYSGYGQTAENHADNIGYDHYDDAIINYD